MTTVFQEKVYARVIKIPRGETRSYSQIAKELKTSARAVGQALKNNPYAPKVPCHRVIKSNGHIGGFKGRETGKPVQEKIMLLKKEGVVVRKEGNIFLIEKTNKKNR